MGVQPRRNWRLIVEQMTDRQIAETLHLLRQMETACPVFAEAVSWFAWLLREEVIKRQEKPCPDCRECVGGNHA